MKRFVSSFLFLLHVLAILCQTSEDSAITMKATYSSEDPDLRDILLFEKIDYFKILFSGPSLAGKDYVLISKEIWSGEVKKADTLIDTRVESHMPPLSSDSLSFKVIAKKTSDQQLKLQFVFPQFRLNKQYPATNSSDYSLRVTGTKMDIQPDSSFCALAYILPYEKDGWKYWCAVESSGKEVETWGKEFGIEHYLIFEMKFE